MPRTISSPNDKKQTTEKNEKFLIVGVGASAGGLDVFRKFFDATPSDTGMAFILVQHLDPAHDSMIVELLSGHTNMPIRQAAEGMRVEKNCIYVIPPGAFLSVVDGLFLVSASTGGHGARLPFDFLLRSLAKQIGERSVGVILSGTGADGSLGISEVKQCGGYIIAQDPADAAYDGMPLSAIATGLVDRTLPVAKVPEALIAYSRWMRRDSHQPWEKRFTDSGGSDLLLEIVELLRANSVYNFSQYKLGTLERRIERRMAISGVSSDDIPRYIEILKKDAAELDALAKDLLINVTNFFRDPKIFEHLAEKIVPDLIEKAVPGQPLRIWSVGCSSGEETYSLVMVFLEQIALTKRPIKLQVFASDIDPDAIDVARSGQYPESIANEVSPERLERFFISDGSGYTVSPTLRESVIFTVQDILTDPPFSRIDFIACRNLMIYLLPEAQSKVISLFEFSLNDQGILLLGASETLGSREDRFEPVFKAERVFRHVAGRSKAKPDIADISQRELRVVSQSDLARIAPRQTIMADLCRRMVLEAFAPATVLVNEKNECVYTLGPISPFFQAVSGYPTNDVLAMAHDSVREQLRSAIKRGATINERIEVDGGIIDHEGKTLSYNMLLQPVRSNGDNLLMICFVETPIEPASPVGTNRVENVSLVAELERELAAKKIELATALYNIDILAETQMTITDEALSVNEEFQATNEELLTSKEELQSLNEELSALNTQLQETLEQQRRASNDLQNVLFSTDLATIFLDTNLAIRFFTPATKAIFNIIQSDIGRPLADLSPLSADDDLLNDARAVLRELKPYKREIKAVGNRWFNRRILPYRTRDADIEGVVITYSDISQQKIAADALDTARHLAELSNSAKSSFLAAASHDLRQPLQTLHLLHGMMEPLVKDAGIKDLHRRLGATLASVSGMLNSLLDINRIDVGDIPVEKYSFSIGQLFARLGDEFAYHAEAKSLELRVVSCGKFVNSDPTLLEQIIRNLLANALKFTHKGRVLLGCRRSGDKLRIEVWDTGVGISGEEINTIFNEYHQVDQSGTDAARGVGLGLAIVKRMADLLGHRISVVSRPVKGTVFSVEVELASDGDLQIANEDAAVADTPVSDRRPSSFSIVLIEDEPEVLKLLERSFKQAGHDVRTARNGAVSSRVLAAATVPPDIIVADFNMAYRTNGLQLALKFREKFAHDIPIVILTGDISSATLRRISQEHCQHMHKPASPRELLKVMHRLVGKALPWKPSNISSRPADEVTINVVEDDSGMREELGAELEQDGYVIKLYAAAETFLEDYQPGGAQCLILDAYLPGMNGLHLLRYMADIGIRVPTIMVTGLSDTQIIVDAMKAGAIDFIEKPVQMTDLRKSIAMAIEQSSDRASREVYLAEVAKRYAGLTPRQAEVMELVLAGHPSKNIAADLGISQRTVENHRAAVMEKTNSKSLPALARFAGALSELNRN